VIAHIGDLPGEELIPTAVGTGTALPVARMGVAAFATPPGTQGEEVIGNAGACRSWPTS
jgi:hypothetical protein